MAVVPFRVSGAAADQSLEHRLFQIGGHTIKVRQNPAVCHIAKTDNDWLFLSAQHALQEQHAKVNMTSCVHPCAIPFHVLPVSVSLLVQGQGIGCLQRVCFAQGSGAHQHIGVQSDSASEGSRDSCAGSSKENLENVGLVVWQSAFVLAEFLMAHPPLGAWHDVRAVDLGTGTGDQLF